MHMLPLSFAAPLLLLQAFPAMSAPPPASLVETVGRVERQYGGNAIEAERDHIGQRPVYEITIFRKGERHEYVIDATDGRLISRKPQRDSWMAPWSDEVPPATRPLAPLLLRIERETHGVVDDVELETENGRALFEVQVTTAAGSAKLHIDPRSGQRLALLHDD